MPSITFHYPQFLILLLLLPLAWRSLAGRRRRLSSWLRLALIALAVLALARPRVGLTGPETDIIVVVDRSASVADASERMLRELLPLIRREERAGDRTAVIGFGDGAVVEQGFSAAAGGTLAPDDFPYASDLSAALLLAGRMRAPDRRTAVLCLTDGLYTGARPLSPTTVAALSGTPFWYRRLGGEGGLDVAAGTIGLPDEAEPRSAWLVRYAILASDPCDAAYTLARNGLIIARGSVRLRRGENHFFVRDTVDGDERLLEYRLETLAAGDSVAENNISRAVLRIRRAPRALVVADGAGEGLLAGALRAAFIPTDIVDPGDFPADAARLSPYRLVVLENCPASDIPGRGLSALAAAVEAGAASLLVTGGANAFGMGGYHRSAVDPLLPVEMELRNDVRRGRMAVAIAMDRSGSMAMGVDGGMVKMDLANLGASESIRLLAEGDQVSVIAVDSEAHVFVPLSHVDNVEALVARTRSIQAMGGGIYCLTALRAAAEQVRRSPLANRHVVLFADAADAEEQEGCFELARELLAEKIPVSVVALGTPDDSDAQFLVDLARVGGGEALFANHASGLPALFTQEIMRISRRGFIDEPVTPAPLPPLRLLEVGGTEAPPELLGYNVSALRDGATAYLIVDDEFRTPLLATRFIGRAATGAVLFEVDGEYSGAFPRWSGASELLVALARRLAGGLHTAGVKAYSSLDHGVALAEFEFSREMAEAARGDRGTVKWLGPNGLAMETPLEWIGPARARTRASLAVPGHYLPFADLGELGTVGAPPVSVSYSAEFVMRDPGEGLAVLAGLAEVTGGGDGLDITQVRASADVARAGGREVAPYLLCAIILLFLLELAGRRLVLFR